MMKAEDLEKATALGRDCGGELCRQTDGFARVFPAGRGTSCIQLTLSLKAPGFNPCAYEVETWFQTFAFKFNLYRYIPEHKCIVEALRQQGFLTGMTGDGVNDAPVRLYKLTSVYP